ncbi:MAG TPA: SCO family protein [Polyangia bacterium]|nr:SCO family protein [Polyangia bacterium]
MSRRGEFSRRTLLAGAVALPAIRSGWAAEPAADHGRIRPPVPAPDLPLIGQDGVGTTLPRLLAQRVTALQVMFTACRTTCPIQGAIFARVQKLIPDLVDRGIQLVSLSVDPAHDTGPVLTRWLRRFGAGPGWRAAAPRPDDVPQVRAFFGAGRTATDNHSTQVQLFDRAAALVWRTGELPEAEEVAALLRRV